MNEPAWHDRWVVGPDGDLHPTEGEPQPLVQRPWGWSVTPMPHQHVHVDHGLAQHAQRAGVRPDRRVHVVLRVLLGTLFSTNLVFQLWFLFNHEIGKHGWVIGAGLGGTMGVIIGYFVSDSGRWRGFGAALTAGITTVLVIMTTTPLAYVDTDVSFDDWGRNLVLGSLFGAIGAIQTARRRGRPPTGGGTYPRLGALVVVSVVLGGVILLRGGVPETSTITGSDGPYSTLSDAEYENCQRVRHRSELAITYANGANDNRGDNLPTTTPTDVDAGAFDNAWFSWALHEASFPGDLPLYGLVEVDPPC